jgi:hypothetical protein
VFRQSSSGFISEDILSEWIIEEFVDYCEFQRRRDKNKPIFIFCDGHTSRFSPHLWETLLHKNIHLLCIPSHSSHLLQVLDLYPNSVVKRNLQTVSNLKPSASDNDIIQFIHKIEYCYSRGTTKDCIFEGLLFFGLEIDIYICVYWIFLSVVYESKVREIRYS